MVKGITKQVVVVKCPETKYFEQAFFLVREGSLEGVNPEAILKEACFVADSYIRENKKKQTKVWPYLLGGAAIVTALAVMVVLYV